MSETEDGTATQPLMARMRCSVGLAGSRAARSARRLSWREVQEISTRGSMISGATRSSRCLLAGFTFNPILRAVPFVVLYMLLLRHTTYSNTTTYEILIRVLLPPPVVEMASRRLDKGPQP